MSSDATRPSFAEFRMNPSLEMMLTFKGWSGGFTASDRDAMERGLNAIRTAMVQPVGTKAADRRTDAVSDAEFSRAVLSVIASAMALWMSGRLDAVEVDDG